MIEPVSLSRVQAKGSQSSLTPAVGKPRNFQDACECYFSRHENSIKADRRCDIPNAPFISHSLQLIESANLCPASQVAMLRYCVVAVSAILSLQWPGLSSAAPTGPRYVYRLDTREPSRLKAEGGFLPAEPKMDSPDHLSLWRHVHGTNIIGTDRKRSAYVSTSRTASDAENIANEYREYWLYRIRATPNFVSARETLGEEHLKIRSAKTEFDALGGIRWDQVRDSTYLPLGKYTPEERRVYSRNTDYARDKFRSARASGAEPRLAGFPKGHEAWNKAPWVEFKEASLQQSALDFMSQTGEMVGWAGSPPLLPNTGAFGVGNSIFYTDHLSPDIQLGSFSEETPQAGPGIVDSKQPLGSAGDGPKAGPSRPCRRATNGCIQVSGQKTETVPRVNPGAEPGNVPEKAAIPERPGKLLHPKLIKGLSYLQAAQFLTAVVDSATAHIKAAQPGTNHETLSSSLKKTGTMLVGIANDTIPGFTDLIEHTAELERKLESTKGNSTLDTMLQIFEAVREYGAQLELTIFENYVPGVPELLSNYKKELAEYEKFKGIETKVQRVERIAKLIAKGAAGTLNDIMRDWIPGYKEAQDSAREGAKNLSKDVLRFHDNKETFIDVLKAGLLTPIHGVADALHKVLRDYVPGEKQVESLAGKMFSSPTEEKPR